MFHLENSIPFIFQLFDVVWNRNLHWRMHLHLHSLTIETIDEPLTWSGDFKWKRLKNRDGVVIYSLFVTGYHLLKKMFTCEEILIFYEIPPSPPSPHIPVPATRHFRHIGPCSSICYLILMFSSERNQIVNNKRNVNFNLGFFITFSI